METIINIESEKPEIHLILGKCAAVLNKGDIFNEVKENLMFFGRNWANTFSAFLESFKEKSLIIVLYDLAQEIEGSIKSLRFNKDSKMHSVTQPMVIFWEDELPVAPDKFASFPYLTQILMIKAFSLRHKIWLREDLNSDDQYFWRTLKETFPDWPLFNRLSSNQSILDALSSIKSENKKLNDLMINEGYSAKNSFDTDGMPRTIYRRDENK